MTQAHKTPGNLVKFKDKVFEEGSPWYPYFNHYLGHLFQVLDNPYQGHVLIRCETGLMNERNPEKPLEICIHDDEIMSASPTEKKKINLK